MFQLLTPETENEYQAFVDHHPNGSFMQSLMWPKVKAGWTHEGVLSRGADGNLRGTILILMQKMPVFGTSFFYAPRGPVCDLHDRETLADLTQGLTELAKKHSAHVFKCDPELLASDEAGIKLMEDLGYTYVKGGLDFETIQPRFNYRLNLTGRTEVEIFAALQQKTRYNVRVAEKKGVTVKVCGEGMLDEFVRLMEITGDRDKFNTRPKAYFQGMLQAMGDRARLYLAFYEGQAVSGAITTYFAGKTSYVYGASDNAHRNVMPNYLMQWEMIRWALENGSDIYDFQGVSGDLSEDNPLYGLYRFKKGFSGDLVELAGEFHLVFKPLVNIAVEKAALVRAQLHHKKKQEPGE